MERKGSPHAALVHLLQEGSIALPAVLFSEYKRLGLNEGQVMLLLHLMVFQEKAEALVPQLNTTHWSPRDLARSLVVSVLPVPAGPDGAPPSMKLRAVVSVM